MDWPKGLPFPYIFTFPTTFYEVGSDKELHHENGLLLMSKGHGLLWGDGTRYRVADTWLSFDKHGRFDVGMHVFLERIAEGGEDDALYKAARDYFG
jgi:hypothetical protein